MNRDHLGERDERLLATLAAIGDTLSLRPTTVEESEWITSLSKLAATHPDPFIRASLVPNASLRQLRHLASDTHLAVRLAAAESPMCIDAELQMTLALDEDASVVHTMLNNVSPYLETVKVLLSSPHITVRLRLAQMNLREDLLDYLSLDDDEKVSQRALTNLSHRRQRYLQIKQ